MRYSWRQLFSNGTTAATLSRFLIISVLLVVGGLAMVASVSSSGPGSKSNFARSAARVLSDRGIGRSAAARRAPEPMPLAPPPVGTINVDRTDDAAGASACTAAANDCSLRGAITFANLSPGTTINVPAGTYNLTISGAGEGFSGDISVGDLDVIGNNTSIVGAGSAVTIIHQTSAGDRVFEVNPFLVAGLVTSISGVTISGGTETTGVGGGGILSGSLSNSLTVSNSIISGNSATGAGTFGGGGICHTGGNLTITGTTFSGNSTSTSGGGISYSAGDPAGSPGSTGTLTVSGSTFTNNTANSAAAGGGALDLYDFNTSAGSYSVSTSSFSSNSAPNRSGGAIIVESGGPLNVTTSSFANNSAANSGGAIFANGTSASVTYSRLVGNIAPTGLDIFRSSGLFSANDDWWGLNTGPAAGDFSSPTGDIMPLDYLKLRAVATPNTICAGATSSIVADIKQRSAGAPLTTELNGLPPFPATFNNTTPAVGSLSAVSANFVNGEATATFTGSTTGTANVDVTADNETETATLTVQENTATTDPADVTVCQGATANFATTASGAGPFSYAWTLDGSPFNGNSPNISVPTGSLSAGNHTVSVTTTGSCDSASQSATLTVQAATATSDPPDQTVCVGATVNFTTNASGTGPFSFVWKKGVVVLASGGRISITNGPSSSTLTITNVQSSDAGTYTVETMGACNTATQSANLAIDSTPPTITCPSNIVTEPTCPSGAVVTYQAPVGVDSCPGAVTTRTAGLASGSVFPIGTTTVTYTVTDSTGQSASCSFTVTVKTVTATIEDLKSSVNASSLSGTQKQGLIAKLNAALDALATQHTSAACQKLADFINSTQNYIDHGNVPAALGNSWISTANHLRNTIGCSGTSGNCT